MADYTKAQYDAMNSVDQKRVRAVKSNTIDGVPVNQYFAPKQEQQQQSQQQQQADTSTVDPFFGAPVFDKKDAAYWNLPGDEVWLNLKINVGGRTFKLAGIKLTAKEICFDAEGRGDERQFTNPRMNICSLIKSVRDAGAFDSNELIESGYIKIEPTFAISGQESVAKLTAPVDLFAKAKPKSSKSTDKPVDEEVDDSVVEDEPEEVEEVSLVDAPEPTNPLLKLPQAVLDRLPIEKVVQMQEEFDAQYAAWEKANEVPF